MSMAIGINESILAAERMAEKRRAEVRKEFASDPWIGYNNLDDALADCKCTTQAEVLGRLLNRENVFISGVAGAGKTWVINQFVKILDADHGGNFNVAITASTGIAATLISGSTIHSWSGLGLRTEPITKENMTKMEKRATYNMRAADVLIIDEISMLPAHFFENLDRILQIAFNNKKSFGGLQVVLMGDFLQLPPVDRDKTLNNDFAISTESWKDLELSYCYMDRNRRSTDPKLTKVLSEVSRGKVSQKSRELIEGRMVGRKSNKKTYTTLFTTNANVDEYNLKEQKKNLNPIVVLKAKPSGPKKKIVQLVRDYKIKELIEVKIGDSIIVSSNITVDGMYIPNGTLGVITEFTRLEKQPVIRLNTGKTAIIPRTIYNLKEKRVFFNTVSQKEETYEEIIAGIEQFPIKLGYAITVHKSQGQTFDGVVMDLSKCFTDGLGYVALSRVRSLDDLVIKGMSERAYRIGMRSKKISIYVKRQALKSRDGFIENREEYEGILKSEMYRTSFIWDVEESSVQRSKKRKRF